MQKNILRALFSFIIFTTSLTTDAFSLKNFFGFGSTIDDQKIEEIKKIIALHEREVLKKFLDEEKNKNAASFQKTLDIAYFEAIKSGDTHLVTTTLESGADINALQKGQTALHIAAQEDDLQMVCFLTKHGIRYKKNSHGKTPAEIAAEIQKKNSEKIIRILCLYIVRTTDQIARQSDVHQKHIVDLEKKISHLAAEQKKYEEAKKDIEQHLAVAISQRKETELTYQKIAQTAQATKKNLSQINEDIVKLEEEINRKRLLQEEQKRLKQELSSIEKENAQQRQKNKKNTQELEKELRELRKKIEEKNIKKAELKKAKRDNAKTHEEFARKHEAEHNKNLANK